jgi:predicted RNA-binding Zn-ribbon protein involved in translation (DUF1610 family)
MGWFDRKDDKKQKMVDAIYAAQGIRKTTADSRCPNCGQPIAARRPQGALGAFFSCPKCGTSIGL